MQDQWRPQVTAERKEPSTSWPPGRPADTMSLTRGADTAPWAAGLQPAQATMRMQPPNVATVSAGQFMMNPSLMQSPQNQAFLASATNLMMGMGLAPSAPTSRTQDARFDAYKGVPGAQLPRY